MDTSLTFLRKCPACRSPDYVFRAWKTVPPEDGQDGDQVETKYRCRPCGHTWTERQPAARKAA